MAFATTQERAELARSGSFGLDFVVQFRKGGRESELAADDVDHALSISKQWIDGGAEYVEVFRVLSDGSLNPTLGPYLKGGA